VVFEEVPLQTDVFGLLADQSILGVLKLKLKMFTTCTGNWT
jgi:hypothetical protein